MKKRSQAFVALALALALGGCSAGQANSVYTGIGQGGTYLFTPAAIVLGIPASAAVDVLLIPLRWLAPAAHLLT